MFAEWGWRIPFLVSLILLVFSVYIRLKLNETPIFPKMKEEGKGSKAPLTESFFHYPNNKYVLLALLGATAGQGVVWYTGQFYALFFLTITLKLDYISTPTLIGLSLIIGTPFFIVFGWLSDRIGRLKIILAGCLIAAITFFPLFKGLTHYVNPDLEAFAEKNPITVTADQATCNFHIFVGPWSKFTDCDRAQDFLTKSGLSFKIIEHSRRERSRSRCRRTKVAAGTTPSGPPRLQPRPLSEGSRPGQDQLVHGRADPGDHGDLRHHGVRADRRVPGRDVPDQDPLHLDVAAVSHRQRLVRRDAAAARNRDRGGDRRYLLPASGIRSLLR